MNRRICGVVCVLCALVVAVNIAFVVKDSFFYNMDNLPQGTYIRNELNQELFLSEGLWLEIYQVEKTEHHPAAVRVALTNINTRESRNVYWQTNTVSTVVAWSDENVYEVHINGVVVDLRGKGYDCRDFLN